MEYASVRKALGLLEAAGSTTTRGVSYSSGKVDDLVAGLSAAFPGDYLQFLKSVGELRFGPDEKVFWPLDRSALEGFDKRLSDTELRDENLLSDFVPPEAGDKEGSCFPGCFTVASDAGEDFYVLVVSGPYRGQIWRDSSNYTGGVRFEAHSFTVWLEGMIEDELRRQGLPDLASL